MRPTGPHNSCHWIRRGESPKSVDFSMSTSWRRRGGLSNATGMAVERDPERCERHRAALPKVQVACSEVTPQNIMSLIQPALDSVDEIDVLKVDIDSYDCPVLEMILPDVRAKIVLVEDGTKDAADGTSPYNEKFWKETGTKERIS
eukprot:g439.t1